MRSLYVLLQVVAIGLAIHPFVATNMFGLRVYDNNDAVLFIFAAIIIFVGAGVGYRRETKRLKQEKSLIACPHCAERIQKQANICRNCGKEVH